MITTFKFSVENNGTAVLFVSASGNYTWDGVKSSQNFYFEIILSSKSSTPQTLTVNYEGFLVVSGTSSWLVNSIRHLNLEYDKEYSLAVQLITAEGIRVDIEPTSSTSDFMTLTTALP
jgi:hypothetical protein